jgi:hypothetical protein
MTAVINKPKKTSELENLILEEQRIALMVQEHGDSKNMATL